ncbi:hypothetical protein Efla_001275 [Eimeria flavescens]
MEAAQAHRRGPEQEQLLMQQHRLVLQRPPEQSGNGGTPQEQRKALLHEQPTCSWLTSFRSTSTRKALPNGGSQCASTTFMQGQADGAQSVVPAGATRHLTSAAQQHQNQMQQQHRQHLQLHREQVQQQEHQKPHKQRPMTQVGEPDGASRSLLQRLLCSRLVAVLNGETKDSLQEAVRPPSHLLGKDPLRDACGAAAAANLHAGANTSMAPAAAPSLQASCVARVAAVSEALSSPSRGGLDADIVSHRAITSDSNSSREVKGPSPLAAEHSTSCVGGCEPSESVSSVSSHGCTLLNFVEYEGSLGRQGPHQVALCEVEGGAHTKKASCSRGRMPWLAKDSTVFAPSSAASRQEESTYGSLLLDSGSGSRYEGAAGRSYSEEPSVSSACCRALTATVSELQARLAAAEHQVTANFVECLRREAALWQLRRRLGSTSDSTHLCSDVEPSAVTTNGETAEVLKVVQEKLQAVEGEREYLKDTLRRKHFSEMELRSKLSSLSSLNEQLQVEASTLMTFHRLADARGQPGAEKLLLQQTHESKELRRLLANRTSEVLALKVSPDFRLSSNCVFTSSWGQELTLNDITWLREAYALIGCRGPAVFIERCCLLQGEVAVCRQAIRFFASLLRKASLMGAFGDTSAEGFQAAPVTGLSADCFSSGTPEASMKEPPEAPSVARLELRTEAPSISPHGATSTILPDDELTHDSSLERFEASSRGPPEAAVPGQLGAPVSAIPEISLMRPLEPCQTGLLKACPVGASPEPVSGNVDPSATELHEGINPSSSKGATWTQQTELSSLLELEASSAPRDCQTFTVGPENGLLQLPADVSPMQPPHSPRTETADLASPTKSLQASLTDSTEFPATKTAHACVAGLSWLCLFFGSQISTKPILAPLQPVTTETRPTTCLQDQASLMALHDMPHLVSQCISGTTGCPFTLFGGSLDRSDDCQAGVQAPAPQQPEKQQGSLLVPETTESSAVRNVDARALTSTVNGRQMTETQGHGSSFLTFTVERSNTYVPTVDDSIDSTVAALSNERINKVLFTRVCQGLYLYGHLAVGMHLSPTGELRISLDGQDYAAKDFIHKFEDQAFHYLASQHTQDGRARYLDACSLSPSGQHLQPQQQWNQHDQQVFLDSRIDRREGFSYSLKGNKEELRAGRCAAATTAAAAPGRGPAGDEQDSTKSNRDNSDSSTGNNSSSESSSSIGKNAFATSNKPKSCRLLPRSVTQSMRISPTCTHRPSSSSPGHIRPAGAFLHEELPHKKNAHGVVQASPGNCGNSPEVLPQRQELPKTPVAPAAARKTRKTQPRAAGTTASASSSNCSLVSKGPKKVTLKQRPQAPASPAAGQPPCHRKAVCSGHPLKCSGSKRSLVKV